MGEIRWTDEALGWLRDIYEYIGADNPAQARRVVSEINAKVQVLRAFPRVGHTYRSEPEGEIRVLHYGHYRIAYLLGVDSDIEILGIFHGALDIERFLP